jgi:hypothetical protein
VHQRYNKSAERDGAADDAECGCFAASSGERCLAKLRVKQERGGT